MRHGLSEQAARAAVQVGANLGARTRRHRVEFAAMLDAESGELTGKIVRGGETAVSVDHFRQMQPGREYLPIHMHPNSTSFSQADAEVLIQFPQVRAVSVVGGDGSWFLLSVAPGRARRDLIDLSRALLAEFAALRPSYVARRDAGLISSAEALRALTHQMWLNLRGKFALRYDRLEPRGE